jgi:uncharacterized protein (DUF1697 family)
MADLADALRERGFHDVRTYLQSGNVVLESGGTEDEVAGAVSESIADRFGFQVPVMARNAVEMRRVAGGHPFQDLGLESRYLMVAFLDSEPSAASPGLSDGEHLPDRLMISGREVYLAYPRGQGRSKLTNDLVERRLGVTSTIRNWNTVSKLADLAG